MIPLLGMYPKKPKTLIQKNICTPVFIAELFTIAKTQKQFTCPPIAEWIKKTWSIYNGTVLKKNEILPSVTAWMDLKGIVLSEISQRKTSTI